MYFLYNIYLLLYILIHTIIKWNFAPRILCYISKNIFIFMFIYVLLITCFVCNDIQMQSFVSEKNSSNSVRVYQLLIKYRCNISSLLILIISFTSSFTKRILVILWRFANEGKPFNRDRARDEPSVRLRDSDKWETLARNTNDLSKKMVTLWGKQQ